MEDSLKWIKPYWEGNEKGLDFEAYERMFRDHLAEMEEKMRGGPMGRMEIHMEENKDGSSRLSIIMEGAKHLAVSASAVLAMGLFAQ